jgi:hypothetical protein
MAACARRTVGFGMRNVVKAVTPIMAGQDLSECRQINQKGTTDKQT